MYFATSDLMNQQIANAEVNKQVKRTTYNIDMTYNSKKIK